MGMMMGYGGRSKYVRMYTESSKPVFDTSRSHANTSSQYQKIELVYTNYTNLIILISFYYSKYLMI